MTQVVAAKQLANGAYLVFCEISSEIVLQLSYGLPVDLCAGICFFVCLAWVCVALHDSFECASLIVV